MTDQSKTTDRRALILGTGAIAGLAATVGTPAMASEMSTTEAANKATITKLYKAVDAMDAEKVAELLHDDFVFQLFDGQPLVEGKEAFLAFFRDFAKPFKKAFFEVHETHVIGNLVINHRTDYFYAKEGGEDQTFEVTGFSVVKDGLVHEWRDYGLPKPV